MNSTLHIPLRRLRMMCKRDSSRTDPKEPRSNGDSHGDDDDDDGDDGDGLGVVHVSLKLTDGANRAQI